MAEKNRFGGRKAQVRQYQTRAGPASTTSTHGRTITHKMVYYHSSNTVSPAAYIYVGKDKVESALSRVKFDISEADQA